MSTNEFFEGMINEMEDKADALDDKGHFILIDDIEALLEKVKRGVYHDFHRNGADAPKVSLATELDTLRANAIDGKYDNHI